jgi:hypothetical protein
LKEEECSFQLPRAEVDKLLDFIPQEGGHLISLAPFQITLEEFYFKTVQDANREDGIVS